MLAHAVALEILRLSRGSTSNGLDLHTFFELTADLDPDRMTDDPERRADVLDIVDRMVSLGLLEPRGSDFYTLTEAGLDAEVRGRVPGFEGS